MVSLRLILVALIWGANFAVVKSALTDFHPLVFTVLRFALSAAVLFGALAARGETPVVDRRDRFAVVKLGFLGITLYNLFFMYGLEVTTASNSALLIAASPLFAALILAITGRERITAGGMSGLLLAFIGVVLTIASASGGIRFGSGTMRGDLLTLVAAAFWAMYTLEAKPLLNAYSAVKITALSMAAGALLLLPLAAVALFRQSWSSISAASWLAFAFSSLVSGSIAFTLWYDGVKRIGAARTIVYHYLMPFFAVVAAALLLGERMGALQIAGGTLIVCGLVIVQKRQASPGPLNVRK